MIRFLADANLNEDIVTGCLRYEPSMDFRRARESLAPPTPDLEVLRIAAAESRIVVSHDFRTMPQHFGRFLAQYGDSPGLFLVKLSYPIAPVIAELILIWSASDSEEWRNRIVRIPHLAL